MSVVLIDDHPVLSLGISQGLQGRGIDAISVSPCEADQVLAKLSGCDNDPVLVVLDLAMPSVSCTPTLVASLTSADIRVIMLSGSEDEDALASCLMAGALAVLSKDESVEAILDTICEAALGKSVRTSDRVARIQRAEVRAHRRHQQQSVFARLSDSEAEVLGQLMDGRSAACIAEDRFVAMPTVRSQIKAVLAKLGVGSQLEAVAYANRNGFSIS